MTKEIKTKETKISKWKKIKYKLLIFFASAFMALIIQAGITVYQVLNEEWHDMGSPYDIQKEYQSIQAITTLRILLLEHGIAEQNFINTFLKSKQLKYYQAMKEKIPDDVILDFLWLDIEYSPYLRRDIKNETLSKFLIDNIDTYFSKVSRIRRIDEVVRYKEIDYFLGYFINTKNFKERNLCKKLLINISPENLSKFSKKSDETKYITKSILINSLAYCLWQDAMNPNFKLCDNKHFQEIKLELKNSDINNIPNINNSRELWDLKITKKGLTDLSNKIFELEAEECKTR